MSSSSSSGSSDSVGKKIRLQRLTKELKEINNAKNEHGIISAEFDDDCLTIKFSGQKDTLFHNEIFQLDVRFDDRYPFHPPRVQLATKVYHPNIDKDGKICLNILTIPPEGDYNPTMSVESIVISIQQLLTKPNASDPLRTDAASDLTFNKTVYEIKVKKQIELNRKERENQRERENRQEQQKRKEQEHRKERENREEQDN